MEHVEHLTKDSCEDVTGPTIKKGELLIVNVRVRKNQWIQTLKKLIWFKALPSHWSPLEAVMTPTHFSEDHKRVTMISLPFLDNYFSIIK